MRAEEARKQAEDSFRRAQKSISQARRKYLDRLKAMSAYSEGIRDTDASLLFEKINKITRLPYAFRKCLFHVSQSGQEEASAAYCYGQCEELARVARAENFIVRVGIPYATHNGESHNGYMCSIEVLW